MYVRYITNHIVHERKFYNNLHFLQNYKGIDNHFGQQSITHLSNCPSNTVCNLSLEKIDDIRDKLIVLTNMIVFFLLFIG